MMTPTRTRHRTGILLLAILLTAAAGCGLQRDMLYHPDSGRPYPQQLAAGRIRFWPTPDAYRGFVGTVPLDGVRGTFVVFHGNAGNAADRSGYVNALAPLGYRVVIAEYPGYGGRPGTPGEPSFVGDGTETVRLAERQFGKPLYLIGESLGCGVAAAVAKQDPAAVDGIILITPWDTLLSVAKEKFPWLPVRLFLSDSYDSVSNLKAFPGRIAIVAAEQDEIIPPHHAQSLFESLPGRKRMWIVNNAGHNNWFRRVDLSWWREITDFVSKGRE